MVAIKKTSTLIKDSNKQSNNAKLYIQRKDDAYDILVDWKKKKEIHWSKYQIKETDMRVKTATFTSPQYIDLTTGQYCILINSTMHEDFGGIIISVDYDSKTGLYNYQCQDFSRAYQEKVQRFMTGKTTVYRLLQSLVTQGGIYLLGNITTQMKKKYKKHLSGLRPMYQYEQKYYGSSFSFNPMIYKPLLIIRNKSYIEVIRDMVYSSGAYIDVYFDKFGVIHIEPYHKKDLYNSGLHLTSPELAQAKYNFDTTNIVTGVMVNKKDKAQGADYYSSETLVKLDLSAFFGRLDTTTESEQESLPLKKSNTANKTGNPYNTKKKVVHISSDNIKGKSTDKKFIEDIAKLLRQNGWKTKALPVGPGYHSEKHMSNALKGGVWFCIYGGADAALLKEASGKNSYTNKLKKLNARTVIGFRGACDIRKGGKCYKYLKRAHDDNYSPRSFTGVSYPANMLTKAKIPFMYADTAKQMASKFISGGDNKEAC